MRAHRVILVVYGFFFIGLNYGHCVRVASKILYSRVSREHRMLHERERT